MSYLLRTALLVLLVQTIACVGPGVKLSEKGKNVRLEQSLDDSEKDKLVESGTIKCSAGRNGRPFIDNKRGCENELRNKASSRGGDIVLIQSAQPPESDYECNNCIEMVGVVYKDSNGKNTAEVAEDDSFARKKMDEAMNDLKAAGDKEFDRAKASAPSKLSTPRTPSSASNSPASNSSVSQPSQQQPNARRPNAQRPQRPQRPNAQQPKAQNP